MKKKGRVFVVSAPSGSGKTTICKRVLGRIRFLARSVSMTTRAPRPNEKDGKDYYYVSRESFKKEVKKDKFLEWERNFGHFYGTPKRFVLEKIKEGKSVLLSIDVKGAEKIKKRFPESVLIFLKPPSFAELSHRLKYRNTDNTLEITKRLKIAKKELGFIPKYDYIVINEKIENAVEEVVSIIKSHEHETHVGRCGRRES